jgi:hypothetical protein
MRHDVRQAAVAREWLPVRVGRAGAASGGGQHGGDGAKDARD